MNTKFYVCPHCGNVIVKLVDSGVVPHCCGQAMQLMQPSLQDPTESNTTSQVNPTLWEKHIPAVCQLDECTLRTEIGEHPHPMTNEHHIRFIYLETERGAQIRFLQPQDKPTATFFCGRDTPKAIYSFCNLHGLWKTPSLPSTIRCKTCCIH